MEDYSSEDYKSRILRRLQRHFSMPTPADRVYTYNFFVKLMEGVTMTREAYEGFCAAMDEELEYCLENGVYSYENILPNSISAHEAKIKPAFAAIGIDVSLSTAGTFSTQATASFTKPDGTQLVYKVALGGPNEFYVNVRSGMEYSYAKRAAGGYAIVDDPPGEGEDLNPHKAGPDSSWEYDSETATLTVTGRGAYPGVHDDEQLGCGKYTTLILGADIHRLLKNCLATSNGNVTTLVCLRPADADLTVGEGIIPDSTRTLDIYADNAALRDYPFPEKVTVRHHMLDEWMG